MSGMPLRTLRASARFDVTEALSAVVMHDIAQVTRYLVAVESLNGQSGTPESNVSHQAPVSTRTDRRVTMRAIFRRSC